MDSIEYFVKFSIVFKNKIKEDVWLNYFLNVFYNF